jgi:1-acyl-sn-glycerol-3-phosphate acyltransferase
MYEIMRLSGQEYVDIYAARAKALDKEAARKQAAAARAEVRGGDRAGDPAA